MLGDLDLACNKLKHFGVDVKQVTVTDTTSYKYTIQSDDCGKVIVINSAQASTVGAPAGLPVGFNIMIVNNSNFVVVVQADSPSNGVIVNNIDSRYTIRARYGICNFICFAESNILISGDLAQ